VSDENVELVLGLQPPRDLDLAHLFRDDAAFAAMIKVVAPKLHPDCEIVGIEPTRGKTIYRGLDGLRAFNLDWLSPWETYRAEIVDAKNLGDRVLLLVRDFGRRKGSSQDVVQNAASIWTLREGEVVRVEFYADRSTAFEAAGLAG
jgi:ketosteroid isomerase-like protein